MSSQINVQQLSALIKAKKGNRGLRTIANEIGGVSASTLSRIEQGKLPDLDTFMLICKWLKVSPENFMSTESKELLSSNKNPTTPEIIMAHLRTDRTLDPETVDALSKMIQLAYDAVKNGNLGNK